MTNIQQPARNVCVFTGSNPGSLGRYRHEAAILGTELVTRGFGLVYGGGSVGLMGTVADAVLEAGGRVTGVIPEALMTREIAHERLDALEVVESMHDRKRRMAELACAFVAMPGGMGTLEELTEVLTWAQLGIHAKPCGILNVDGYFDGFLEFLDHAVAHEFLKPDHRAILRVGTEPGALLDDLEAYRPRHTGKWLTQSQA